MNIENVLESIRKFLDVDGWTYFHLKVDSPSGQRREMLITNVPVVTEEIQGETQPGAEPMAASPIIIEAQPVEETAEEKFRRIYSAICQDQMPQGTDEEWWKNMQLVISMEGTKPQVTKGEPMESALAKVREAGLI